jgi:endonuclease YncB( thermonuclease family)
VSSASTERVSLHSWVRGALAAVMALFLAAPACAAGAQQFTGRVLAVEDGDTVRVQRGQGDVRVRIFGIDAPEAAQPFGPEAREMARRLLLDRTVVVAMRDVDQYGRLVAALSVDGRDIGTELIASGAAWNYAQFSQDDRFATLESRARDARRGLWALPNPTPPWLFRSAARGSGAGPGGARGSATGALHGNVASRVFHAPGCDNYDCANCTASFESPAAAVAAGYRPHRECVR